MVRYVAVPAVAEWYEARATDYLARTVHEAEAEKPSKTGLLDASGTPLYRVEVMDQIGFIRRC